MIGVTVCISFVRIDPTWNVRRVQAEQYIGIRGRGFPIKQLLIGCPSLGLPLFAYRGSRVNRKQIPYTWCTFKYI